MVVDLGVMGVMAPSSNPLSSPFTLSSVTFLGVAVQLWRALVVLVVLGEVVLLLVVVGGRRMAPAALVHLAVPAKAVRGRDGLSPTDASPAAVLTVPGWSRH